MMMKRLLSAMILSSLFGCAASAPPEVLKAYQGRTLYTCCNMHYESADISDANYYSGTLLPAGSQAQVQNMKGRSVTFTADGHPLTLTQSYGTQQETFQAYLDKVLVADDPKAKLASWPKAVQNVVRQGQVEVGMTRDQVIMSLGYPPTHRTPSLNDPVWKILVQPLGDVSGRLR